MAREAKQEYRYHEDGAIALYRRPNSAMWYARCKLDDGVALNPFSTGTDDEREAVKIAKKRMLYAEVDRERGIEPGGKTFAFIAEQWLKRKRVEVEKGLSTKIKVDAYEAIVRRFHIPYFGKTKITEITPRKLTAYEDWRATYWTTGPSSLAETETIRRKDGKEYVRKTKRIARGKRDAEDTVLRQIFKFAVKEEYLPVERMPTVGGKQSGSTNGNGRHSNRRPAFTAEQATKLLNYDANEFYPISDKMTPEAVIRHVRPHRSIGHQREDRSCPGHGQWRCAPDDVPGMRQSRRAVCVLDQLLHARAVGPIGQPQHGTPDVEKTACRRRGVVGDCVHGSAPISAVLMTTVFIGAPIQRISTAARIMASLTSI